MSVTKQKCEKSGFITFFFFFLLIWMLPVSLMLLPKGEKLELYVSTCLEALCNKFSKSSTVICRDI